MKTCIRCWCTEKEIRKMWWKCSVYWTSYKRHDYSEWEPMPEDWKITLLNKSK